MLTNAFATNINTTNRTSNNSINSSRLGSIPLFKCWIHKTNGHEIIECNNFLGMTSADKTDAVKRSRACFRCLYTGHMSRDYPTNATCEHVMQK